MVSGAAALPDKIPPWVWVSFLSNLHGKDEVQEVFENLFKQGIDDNEAHGQDYSEITKVLVCP